MVPTLHKGEYLGQFDKSVGWILSPTLVGSLLDYPRRSLLLFIVFKITPEGFGSAQSHTADQHNRRQACRGKTCSLERMPSVTKRETSAITDPDIRRTTLRRNQHYHAWLKASGNMTLTILLPESSISEDCIPHANNNMSSVGSTA